MKTYVFAVAVLLALGGAFVATTFFAPAALADNVTNNRS